MIDVKDSFSALKQDEKAVITYLGFDPFTKVGKACKIYIPEQTIEESNREGKLWHIDAQILYSELEALSCSIGALDQFVYSYTLKGLGKQRGFTVTELSQTLTPKFSYAYGFVVSSELDVSLPEEEEDYSMTSEFTLQLWSDPEDKDGNTLEWKVEAFIEFLE